MLLDLAIYGACAVLIILGLTIIVSTLIDMACDRINLTLGTTPEQSINPEE